MTLPQIKEGFPQWKENHPDKQDNSVFFVHKRVDYYSNKLRNSHFTVIMKYNMLMCLSNISSCIYLFSNDGASRLLAYLIYGFNYILITLCCVIVLYMSSDCEGGIDFTWH